VKFHLFPHAFTLFGGSSFVSILPRSRFPYDFLPVPLHPIFRFLTGDSTLSELTFLLYPLLFSDVPNLFFNLDLPLSVARGASVGCFSLSCRNPCSSTPFVALPLTCPPGFKRSHFPHSIFFCTVNGTSFSPRVFPIHHTRLPSPIAKGPEFVDRISIE